MQIRRIFVLASAVSVVTSALLGHGLISPNQLQVAASAQTAIAADLVSSPVSQANHPLIHPTDSILGVAKRTSPAIAPETMPLVTPVQNQAQHLVPRQMTKSPTYHLRSTSTATGQNKPAVALHSAQTSSKTPRVAPAQPAPVQSHTAQSNVDLYWLSRAVEAEAGGEAAAVKLAVADVILNRVHSPSYPNTVKDVIFQRVQGIYAFTPVSNGWIYHEPSPASIAAAKQALFDHKNIVPQALVFYNGQQTPANNWVRTRPIITTIGAMTFAR